MNRFSEDDRRYCAVHPELRRHVCYDCEYQGPCWYENGNLIQLMHVKSMDELRAKVQKLSEQELQRCKGVAIKHISGDKYAVTLSLEEGTFMFTVNGKWVVNLKKN